MSKYENYKRCRQKELAKNIVKNQVIDGKCHPEDVAKRLDVSRQYIYKIIKEVDK